MRQIPFSPPDITEEEINAAADAMRSGWITTGPQTKQFEQEIAEYCHTKRVACLNSDTACMEMTLRLFGIGPGDEVITTAYTYTATASVICHVGAVPVLVDLAEDTYEMDYDALEAAVTPKTKAVIPVDIAGVLCDHDRILDIADQKKDLFTPSANRYQQALGRILVMADSAHGFGAVRDGMTSGEIADFTTFSFHAVKNLTTAEGGAVTWREIPGIDSDEIYRDFMLLSLHGQSKDALAKTKLGAWEYDILAPAYKCNMTDIMAAIGLRQLDRYPRLLARRKEIIGKYDVMCDELGVKHLLHYTENSMSSGHLYLTRIPGTSDEIRREIIIKLIERGVNTNVHYKPLPMMTAYKKMGWDIKDFPNAYDYYANLITLPLHTKLSDEDVEYIISSFKEVVRKHI